MTTRWGIMGAAGIARKMFLPAVATIDNASVVAIASRSSEKAQALADQFHVQTIYDSYDKLLAAPDIDAIYVPLPNDQHVRATIDALRAGKHVLCEKPISLNTDEIHLIKVEAEKARRHAVEGFMVAYHPQWQKVRDWIEEGKIGAIQRIEGVFSYFLDDKSNIRNRSDGGALRDVGVYPIFVTRLISGQEPHRVMGHMRTDVAAGADTHTMAWMEFDGFEAAFYVSARADRSESLVIYGTHGRIEVPHAYNPPNTGVQQIHLFKGNALDTIETFHDIFQFAHQVEHLSAVFQGRGDPRVTLENSTANQRVLDAVRRAAQSQRWEDVT